MMSSDGQSLQYRPKFSFPGDLMGPQEGGLEGMYVRWALGPVQQVDEHGGAVTVRCLNCTLEFPSVGRGFVELLLGGEWHRTEDLYRSVSGHSTLEAFRKVLVDLWDHGVILVKEPEGREIG